MSKTLVAKKVSPDVGWHALQVVMDLPYVQADCFSRNGPAVVPARTFLSQLL